MGPALFLAACLMAGLVAGAAAPYDIPAAPLAIPALAVQTLLTVGGLPSQGWREAVRGGAALLATHHIVSTLPFIAVGALIGLDTPLGFGVFVMAAAPPAAVTPAYAVTSGIDARPVLAFCLAGYFTGIVLTPLLIGMVAVSAADPALIGALLVGGLIAPTIVGRLVRPWVVRIPRPVRRGILGASMFVVTLGLGGGMVEAFATDAFGWGAMGLAVLIVIARTFGSAAAAVVVAPRRLRDAAPFAGGFKNAALAAAVAGPLLGPVAAIPALVAFAGEVLLFLTITFIRGRSGREPPIVGPPGPEPPAAAQAGDPDR